MVITVDNWRHGGVLLPRQAPLAGKQPSLCIELTLPVPLPRLRQGIATVAPPLTATLRFALAGGPPPAPVVSPVAARSEATPAAWPPLALARRRPLAWGDATAARVLEWVRPAKRPLLLAPRLQRAGSDSTMPPVPSKRQPASPMPTYVRRQTTAWSQAALRLRARCLAAVESFRHPPGS